MLCVGFHKMFPITTIIAITTKNFFFIQSHSFAKFRFVVLSRTEQTLVKGEQSLVDFKDIVVLIFDEILNDDVEFV